MTIRKLLEGIYVDTDGTNGGNHGAILLDDEILMIDSGMIHTKSRLCREYLEKELDCPIKHLIFTHSHGDHVFGAQAFEPVTLISSALMKEECDVRLKDEWKHDILLERYSQVKDERPELWDALQTLSIRLPDRVFNKEMSLGNQQQVTAKLTGGHTAGSSIVISHEHNAVFVGDLIFSGQFPYGGDSTCNPDEWIHALENIYKENYAIIIPGHGPVCHQEYLGEYIDALGQLKQSIIDAIQKGQSIETFIERRNIPKTIEIAYDRFGEVTIRHWFNFYS